MFSALKFIRNIRKLQQSNEFGWTEIHKATWRDHHAALTKYISAHPDLINKGNIYGVTALHLAVRWNRIKCLEILISQIDIDVNCVDEDGWTPLHDAARLGRVNCIELLLSHADIDIHIKDIYGLTPIYLTTTEGYADCLKLLLQTCPETVDYINEIGCKVLHNLVRFGRSECIEILLQFDINVDVPDRGRSTPLHYAAIFGQIECLELLIHRGRANVNAVNTHESTPLHIAIQQRKLKCALKLINCPNIDVNIPDLSGCTPLRYAVLSEDINIVKELIDKKQARTDIPDQNGWTCEHEAAARNSVNILKILDNRNLLNLYRITKSRETVLSYMNKEVLKFYLNVEDKNGLNLLQHAAIQKQSELIKLLVEDLRKVTTRNKYAFPPNDFTPRHTIKGRGEEVKQLYDTLEKQQQVSIFGPGGIGKTAFVKFYAWSHKNLYHNNIVWIDCESQSSIANCIRRAAKYLRIPTKKYETNREISLIMRDVFIQLEIKPSLIVLDNINEMHFVILQLLGNIKFHVVLICRKNLFRNTNIPCIELKSISEQAALEFFNVLFHDKILAVNDEENILLLIRKLKCIPVCLVTAKFYILQEYLRLDLKQYIKELDEELEKMPYIFIANEAERIIYSIFILMLKKNNICTNLLAAASYMDPYYLDIETLMKLGKIIQVKDIFEEIGIYLSNSFIKIVNNKIHINSFVRDLILYHSSYKVSISECYRNILTLLTNGDYSKHYEYIFKFRFDDRFSFANIIVNLRSFKIIKPLVRYSYIKNLTELFSLLELKLIKQIVKKRKLLHEAVKSGDIKTVEFIYQFDSKIEKYDEFGHTMIWEAIDKNYIEILDFLIAKGASFKHIDKLNKTPLHRAAFLGKAETVKLLLDKGANPNVRNKFHRTPLHYAAMEGHNDVIEELLNRKDTQIDARDHYRRSPVFETIRCFQIDSLILFINKGAKINTKDNMDLCPVRLAMLQKNKKEILDVFKEYGFYEEPAVESTYCTFC